MRTVLLLCALAFPAPLLAEDKPADLLIGKWEVTGGDDNGLKENLEFTKDGRVKATHVANGKILLTVRGTYKLLDDKTLETTPDLPGGQKPVKAEFKVTKDSLETVSGEPTKVKRTYKRAK